MAFEKRTVTSRRQGFSLLELAVVIGILSLIVAFGFNLSINAVEGADRLATQERLTLIKRALEQYGEEQGYLPCPARRDYIPSSHATFGDEQRSGTSCATAGSGVVQVTVDDDSIFIGSLPTKTLGLPDAYAGDGWGNKFTYAVSAGHVGEGNSYLLNDGPITVRYGDRTGTNYAITTQRDGTAGPAAIYVVVSHGPDGKGAWPMSGTSAAVDCGASGNNDVENCDDDDFTFYDTAYNDGTTEASFFDDYVVWGSNALDRMEMPSAVVYCPGATLNWTVGSDTCSAIVPSDYYTAGDHDVADLNAPTTGEATFECLGNDWADTPEPGATCDSVSPPPAAPPVGACDGGNCARWCAPCSNRPPAGGRMGRGRTTSYKICEKEITSHNPCKAHCVYGSAEPGTFDCP